MVLRISHVVLEIYHVFLLCHVVLGISHMDLAVCRENSAICHVVFYVTWFLETATCFFYDTWLLESHMNFFYVTCLILSVRRDTSASAAETLVQQSRVTRFSGVVTKSGRICEECGDQITKSGHSFNKAGAIRLLSNATNILQKN